MKYDVYLARARKFRYQNWSEEKWIGAEDKFELVARVEAENLSDLWEKCQHRTDPWHERDCVQEVFGEDIRSLSVGDVVCDKSIGAYYRVDAIGFTEIPPPHEQPA